MIRECLSLHNSMVNRVHSKIYPSSCLSWKTSPTLFKAWMKICCLLCVWMISTESYRVFPSCSEAQVKQILFLLWSDLVANTSVMVKAFCSSHKSIWVQYYEKSPCSTVKFFDTLIRLIQRDLALASGTKRDWMAIFLDVKA